MAGDTCMIYADSLEHDAVLAYRMDLGSGDLTPVGDPVEVPIPWAMGVSPDRRFLYVVSHADHTLTAIALDPHDGSLRRLDTLSLPPRLGLMDPSYIHIDPTGQYLLTCDYWTDKIGSFEIGEDGRLKPESAAVVTVGSGVRGSRGDRQHPHSIQLDPQANYVIVPFTGKDRIEFYRWSEGRIVSPSVAYFETVGGTGPRHCAFHPTRPFVYFNNERGARNSRVTQYELTQGRPGVEERGTWSTLPEGSTLYNAIADIHITPNGRFLYVSNRGHDSLAGFKISDANGSLEPLGPFPTGAGPTTFAIDPTGRFVVVSSLGSGTLSVHRINESSGALSAPSVVPCAWSGRAGQQFAPEVDRPAGPDATSGEKYARGKGHGAPWVIAI